MILKFKYMTKTYIIFNNLIVYTNISNRDQASKTWPGQEYLSI